MADEWVLSVDVGTSRSAGAMANGVVTPLEVEGNRWMPSMVLLDPSGTLVVGSAADYQAGVYPDRVERTPKRYLGGPAPLLLGGNPVEVPEAIASLIRVFIKEGQLRRGGQHPAGSVLTHPVRWGDVRKEALATSARLAGLTDAVLIEEPVAAAIHYVGDQVEVGQCVGVYDLGGGTFDTAVLARTETGFETVGAPGGDDDIGGEHFDHVVYEFLGACLGDEDPGLWEEIQYGEDRKWTRAAADLLLQARRAKEAVSSYPSTQVLLPLVDRDVVFTRAQFEEMIAEQIEATIDEMSATIASAGMAPEDVAAIYLVGGSSRIPLVTQLMTERFGDRIATRDEPKGVVALGAAQVARQQVHPEAPVAPRPAPLPPGAPVATVTTPAPPVSPPSGPRAWPGPGAPGSPAAWPAGPGAQTPTSWPAGTRAPGTAPWPGAPAPPPPPPSLSEAWRIDLRSEVYASMASGPSIHVTDASNQLHQLGLDGRWRWSTRLPSPAFGRPEVAGDIVVVGCAGGEVIAVDQRQGHDRFRRSVASQIVAAPHAIYDGFIVADDSGTLTAFGNRDGSVRWVLPIGTAVRAPLANVGPAVLVAGADGKVYRVDQATGRVSWAFPAPAPVTSTPLVADDEAFVACTSGMLYCVNVTTGQARWGKNLGAPVDGNGVVAGAFVLFATRAGVLQAIDRQNGSIAWNVQTGGPNSTGVVLAGTTAYVDNNQGSLVAVDVSTRSEAGRVNIAAGSWQSPTVAGGLVLVREQSFVRAINGFRR